MQKAETERVNECIQCVLAYESWPELDIARSWSPHIRPSLTAIDAQYVVECLRNLTRIEKFAIRNFRLDTPALNVFRNGLPSCTCLTRVRLDNTELGNEGLEHLLPAFHNTSITTLRLGHDNHI